MSLKNDILKVISNMSNSGKIFVSERHLQVSFALELMNVNNKYVILPEYTFQNFPKKHIDLIIQDKNNMYAIEFKYVTAKLDCQIYNNNITLKEQGAIDNRLYDSLKDIERLEEQKKKGLIKSGYFILITNEKKFWNKSSIKETSFDNFRIHNGITKGRKEWNPCAQAKNNGERSLPITISNNYNVNFNSYHTVPNTSCSNEFKSLIIEV